MIKSKKNFLITGNDNLSLDLFVSNFAYNKKIQKEEVFIINDSNFNIFTKIKKAKINEDDKILKNFELYTDKFIPLIKIKEFIDLYQDKQNKKLITDFLDKINNIIVVSDFEGIYNDLYNEFEDLIIVINNEPQIINDFYKLIKKINNFGLKFNFNIVISNVKFFEDGVKIFTELKNEILNLLFIEKSVNFLGFFSIDMQKVYISLKRGEVYIKIFNEDQFHGAIKWIDDKLKELSPLVIEESFILKIMNRFYN